MIIAMNIVVWHQSHKPASTRQNVSHVPLSQALGCAPAAACSWENQEFFPNLDHTVQDLAQASYKKPQKLWFHDLLGYHVWVFFFFFFSLISNWNITSPSFWILCLLLLCMSELVLVFFIYPHSRKLSSDSFRLLLQAKQAQLPHPHVLQPPDQLSVPPVWFSSLTTTFWHCSFTSAS